MTGLLLQFPKRPGKLPVRDLAALGRLKPHQITAWTCLGYPELVNPWEGGFLSSVAGKPAISDRELTCLQGIACKVERGRK